MYGIGQGNYVNVGNIQWSAGNTTNYAVWPVQVVAQPAGPEDDFAWLRRRVTEITDMVKSS